MNKSIDSSFSLKKSYKISQTIKMKNDEKMYKDWPKENDIFLIKKNNKVIARFEVKHVTKEYIYGVIINTYGHKRRKQ